jgi:exosome complex exonuclease RRP6
MRNELIDKSDFSNPEEDRVRRVLEKSKETSLQTYENPIYDAKDGSGPVGWYKALFRNPNAFNKEQFSVFKAVHQWRDNIARQEDESLHYVMANHALFSVARSMPLDKPALFNVAQPISPIVRLRADELVGTIARAKEAGADGPEMWEVFGANPKAGLPAVAPTTSVALSPAFKELARPAIGDTALVRSDRSAFWGNAFRSSLWQQQRFAATESIRLAVPLPPLTAEIFTDPADASMVQKDEEKKAVDPAARAEHAYVKAEDRPAQKQDDGIFVIKQLGGRKRKLEETSAMDDATAEEAAASHNSGEGADVEMEEDVMPLERKLTKSQKRKMRHEKQQKLHQEDQGSSGVLEEETEAFDYAAAPSVVKATAGQPEKKDKKDKKKKKEFNPYARAADAPKGLGRVQKERAGKSATFKK